MAWRQIRDHILHLNRSACATSTVGKKDSTVHYTSLHVMKLHFIALNYIVWHASNANAGVKYIKTCSVCRLKSLFACVCIFGTELLRSKPQVKCSVKEASTRFWRKFSVIVPFLIVFVSFVSLAQLWFLCVPCGLFISFVSTWHHVFKVLSEKVDEDRREHLSWLQWNALVPHGPPKKRGTGDCGSTIFLRIT